jgi:hypothetical protein
MIDAEKELDSFCDSLIGKTDKEAIKAINDFGLVSRVICRNNHYFAITRDFKVNRLNLTIDNDIVTKVSQG